MSFFNNMDFLTIGSIYKAHGYKGEVNITPSTDFPTLRFKKGTLIYLLLKDGTRKEVTIVSARHNNGSYLVKFDCFETPEEIAPFIHALLQVEKKREDLQKGYFYHSDLEGLNVIDEKKEFLGIVNKVEEYSTQKCLRVKRDGKNDFFVPFVKAFIKEVNLEDKTITIHVIEGML